MRRRVSGATGRFPLSAYETVLIDTPAASATSLMFAMSTSSSVGSSGRSASRKRFDRDVRHNAARSARHLWQKPTNLIRASSRPSGLAAEQKVTFRHDRGALSGRFDAQ